MEFQGRNMLPLTETDYANAAKELGCQVADVKAVVGVEAPRGGFIADGRPTILFESHAFHTVTGGKYDASHPDISTSTWVHNYGAGGAHQYDRLNEAIELDREAALKSASWGAFQIMGSNFNAAGYNTVEAFVADMCDSEGYQLDAFVTFLQNTGADQYLDAENWSAFALHYNGPGQVDVYAQRIAEARANATA